MANFKIVMVFQQTTTGSRAEPTIGYTGVPRTAGWTESYWDIGVSRAEAIATAKGPRTDSYPPILQARAGCLNSNAQVLGFRIYEVGGGRGEFIAAAYPGTATAGDQPSAALLCQSISDSTPTVRRFTMRGIPDDAIKGGEFTPNDSFLGRLQLYFGSLSGTDIYGRAPIVPFPIFDISDTGLLTAEVPLSYTVGQIVTIQNTLTEDGKRVGGRFRISALGGGTAQIILQGWVRGRTTGGKVFVPTKDFYIIPSPSATTAVRACNHKVGRPFAAYRGRNSK